MAGFGSLKGKFMWVPVFCSAVLLHPRWTEIQVTAEGIAQCIVSTSN